MDFFRQPPTTVIAPLHNPVSDINIKTYEPTRNHFVSDVYFNGQRVFCGRGSQNRQIAVQEAVQWMNEHI